LVGALTLELDSSNSLELFLNETIILKITNVIEKKKGEGRDYLVKSKKNTQG